MARILLADDERATRDLVSRALAMDGHQVVAVEDGSEALARLTAEPGGFALLISDVQMPVLDGLSLAEKALAQQPKLAIILMSGLADGFAAAGPIGSRVRRMVTKPFTLEEMRVHVRTVLGG